MKRFGSFAGVAFTVALLVSACSQAPVQSPELKAQFGTKQDDQANAVAVDPNRGRVYVAGTLEQDAESPAEQGGNLILRSYTQAGRYVWNKTLAERTYYDPLARGVGTDAAGNIYLAWYVYSTDGYDSATIVKFSPARKVLYKVEIDNGINDFAVDLAGNVYVAGIADRDGFSERDFLRKYDPRGQLVWERATLYDDNYEPIITAQSIPTPYDIGLAGDGSIYAAGVSSLTKYSNNGRTLWTLPIGKNANNLTVAAGKKDAYVAVARVTNDLFSIDLKKVDRTGSVSWSRNVKLPNEGYLNDLTVDNRDSVYLSGSVFSRSSDNGLFVTKYDRAGKQVWLYVPRNAADYEGAVGLGIAVQGEDVYVAGSTKGKVNGKNRGNRDAFLLKLNARGQRVWQR